MARQTKKKRAVEAELRPELGDRVKDKINGFEGIVLGEYNYLTGCRQLGVAPEKLGADGNPRDWQTFDESRIKVIERGVHPVVVLGKLDTSLGGPAIPVAQAQRGPGRRI